MKKSLMLLSILILIGIILIRQVAWINLDSDDAREVVILTRNYHLFVWDEHQMITRSVVNLSPWKLAFGDINGDGIPEIAIGVYKSTPLHHVAVRRAFFYALRNAEIVPVLRMSRTYEPLLDFYITDHLITIETNQAEYFSVHYAWSGFGFDIARRDGPFASVAEALKHR